MVEVERKTLQATHADDQRRCGHPCLFIVNLSESPEATAAIVDYIALRGKMNVLQDVEAGRLATAGKDKDQEERYLAAALGQANHVMILVSSGAPNPRWLNRLVDLSRAVGAELVLLALKGMAESETTYNAFEVLRGIKSLNEYIFRVSPEVDRIIFNNPEYGGLMAHTAPNHPLDAYLDWDK